MNTDFIKGVIVPILTVIDQDEKIDESGMRAQVDFVIKFTEFWLLEATENSICRKKMRWSAD